jgi:hypothetical protein
MSASDRAEADYSKGNSASRPGLRHLGAARAGLLALAAIGALLLIVSDFQTLYEVKVLTVVKKTVIGHEQHSFAMLLIGLAALAMTLGSAVGPRARPAMAAVALLGGVALLIALIGDLPDVNSTGLIGQLYEDASAGAKIGFFMETLGAVALIFSGASMLVLTMPTDPRSRSTRSRRGRRERGPGGGAGRPADSAAASSPVDAEDAGWL